MPRQINPEIKALMDREGLTYEAAKKRMSRMSRNDEAGHVAGHVAGQINVPKPHNVPVQTYRDKEDVPVPCPECERLRGKVKALEEEVRSLKQSGKPTSATTSKPPLPQASREPTEKDLWGVKGPVSKLAPRRI